MQYQRELARAREHEQNYRRRAAALAEERTRAPSKKKQ
jgi:hypothetical protein